MKRERTLAEWAQLLGASLVGLEWSKAAEMTVRHISDHSQKVQPQGLFFAISGSSHDGKRFVGEALQRGALAVVCEPPCPQREGVFLCVPDVRQALAKGAALFYSHPLEKMKTVGITGTNGKTTTSYLLASILEASGLPTSLIGTTGYRVGGAWETALNTTPSSLTLHQLGQKALRRGDRAWVMEVSSHALSQERTFGIPFDGAIFTNLSRDHLDYHKTFSAYRQAKAKLFQQLTSTSVAALSADDPNSAYLARTTSAKVVTYGLTKGATYTVSHLSSHLEGSQFLLRAPHFSLPVQLQLLGLHNVQNALAAAALAAEWGIHPGHIQKGLEGLEAVPGRLEAIANDRGLYVFVDYAHTPDALERVLQCLRSYLSEGQKIFTVVGCGGNRDRGKRPLMARIAEELSHWVYLTSDNPRWEPPLQILKDMQAGLTQKRHLVIPDRQEAIFEALRRARRGDVVLIAGKGHETYQEIEGVRHPFDDREVAREALKRCRQVA